MWQCDFACKKKWTMRGMLDLYFLDFIHIGSRRIWISSCNANPSGEWTAQQARNFSMHMEEQNLSCTILQRDQDTKYIAALDHVFKSDGTPIKSTPAHSPNRHAYVERVNQTVKHEVLNGFCMVSESHLNHILRTSQDWYNHLRGHSA